MPTYKSIMMKLNAFSLGENSLISINRVYLFLSFVTT